MVWGKNYWSAASDGTPYPKRAKRALRRLSGYAEQGTAYLGPSPRWKYPDVYVVNGTNYTNTGTGVYKDASGAVLTA